MPGPPPTPTETLEARGSWRANVRAAEPRDAVVIPDPPIHLDEEGMAEWARLVPLLERRRTISEVARGALAGLCQAWSVHVWASKRLNDERKKKRPKLMDLRRWASLSAESFREYMRAGQEFGLTPASKARVQAEGVSGDDGDGATLRFFDGSALG